jgi:hypothetical protein
MYFALVKGENDHNIGQQHMQEKNAYYIEIIINISAMNRVVFII